MGNSVNLKTMSQAVNTGNEKVDTTISTGIKAISGVYGGLGVASQVLATLASTAGKQHNGNTNNTPQVKVPFVATNNTNKTNNATPSNHQQPQQNNVRNQNKNAINPNEPVNVELPSQYKNAVFVPQSLMKGRVGMAAGYAFSKGDYFGGVTFLSEGISNKAFYLDPASNPKNGTLINTNPGITLSRQNESTIRAIFKNTSLAGMTDEIIHQSKGGRGGTGLGISSNMAKVSLQVGDYYNMFKVVQGSYSNSLVSAMKERLPHNPHAKALLSSGMSRDAVMRKIQENLPPASYGVLQHMTYKFGGQGVRRFGKVFDGAISAALDPANQEQHLTNGAKHMVYYFRNKNSAWQPDTRVMDIHRIIFTSGKRLSPELNLKLATQAELNANELNLVSGIAKQAGVSGIIKDGRVKLPDSPTETLGNSQKLDWDEKAANRGMRVVNQDAKPVPIDMPKPQPNNHQTNIPKPPQPKRHGGGGVTVEQIMSNL